MLEIIVFVCGAVVMILEMVGSRILAPYLGTSIVVWTSLIGVILGCLSLGYWWGGKVADRNPSYKTLSLIVLLAAVFIATVALSKSMILDLLQRYSENVHLDSTLATLVLFAPPSILLGMVSPYSVRLKMNDLERSGRTVGSLYALSTLGSIFGTFLAGFILIAFLGSTSILLFLSLALTVASFLAFQRYLLLKAAAAILFVLIYLAVASYDRQLANMDFFDIDTNYNRILIYSGVDSETARGMRIMVTNPKAVQSAMYLDDPLELALNYTKFYELAMHFKPDMKRILMLGGGGYSYPKHALSRYPGIQIHVVELDPQVTALARRFFALRDDPRLVIHHEDARTFLNRNHEPFDVILGDTFSSHYSIPFHLSTLEVVRRLHGLLAEDGLVMTNILSSIEGDAGRFLQAEVATFREVFPQVYLVPVADPTDGKRWQNVMLVAMKSQTKPAFQSDDAQLNGFLTHLWTKPIPRGVPVLTDDYAPVDRYVLNWP